MTGGLFCSHSKSSAWTASATSTVTTSVCNLAGFPRLTFLPDHTSERWHLLSNRLQASSLQSATGLKPNVYIQNPIWSLLSVLQPLYQVLHWHPSELQTAQVKNMDTLLYPVFPSFPEDQLYLSCVFNTSFRGPTLKLWFRKPRVWLGICVLDNHFKWFLWLDRFGKHCSLSI